MDGIAPKLTVLMIGTNNTGHRQDPAEVTAQGIRMILDELLVRLPSTKILLLAIFPRGEKPSDPLRVLNSEINEIIQGFADNSRVFYRDIGPQLAGETGCLSAEVFPDFLHPEEDGYRLWAEAIEPDICALLK